MKHIPKRRRYFNLINFSNANHGANSSKTRQSVQIRNNLWIMFRNTGTEMNLLSTKVNCLVTKNHLPMPLCFLHQALAYSMSLERKQVFVVQLTASITSARRAKTLTLFVPNPYFFFFTCEFSCLCKYNIIYLMSLSNKRILKRFSTQKQWKIIPKTYSM